MTELSGARYRAGFGHYRQQFVYNVRIPRAQEILHVDRKVHTAEHVASAMFFLGAPICEIPRAKLVADGSTGTPGCARDSRGGRDSRENLGTLKTSSPSPATWRNPAFRRYSSAGPATT